MTDFMFGDVPDMGPLEEGPDDYDEFNDETFGSVPEIDNWQNTHEKFSTGYGNATVDFEDDFKPLRSKTPDDSGCYSGERGRTMEENFEKSISKLVLDDEEEDMYGPSRSSTKSQPIKIGSDGANMSQLFGPSSPPALFDPQEFISPGSRRNIWGSPTPTNTAIATEQHLKSILNIRPKEDHLEEQAGGEPAKKVFTLEELERNLTSRAPPKRTVSPILGSPPMSQMMPVGTPPQHSFMQRTPSGILHQQQHQLKQQQQQLQQQQQQLLQQQQQQQQKQQQQQMHSKQPTGQQPMTSQQQMASSHAVQQLVQQIHQSIGGRVSPTQITQLVLSMQAASGRASPNQIRQLIMASQHGSASPFPRPMGPGVTPTPKGMGPSPGMTPRPGTPRQGGPPRPGTPMQQQRMGSPMMQQQQRPMSPMMHQQRPGSPMMQQGRPPMMPFSPGGMMGGQPPRTPHGMHGPGPHRNFNTYGLTPMHPQIPPMRPFSDPGMRRRFPFNANQRPYSQTPNRYGDHRHQQQWPNLNQNRFNDRRFGPGGDANVDEYANLMTQREKEWVQKIQLLQLQSNNPDVDDYYYQAYMQKKQGLEEQGREGVQGEKKNNGKDASKIIPAKILEARVYQPAQFEGALGRVTSSSVNNPRQLIDFHIEAPADEDENGKPSAAKEQSKRRRTLLSIERVYGILLQLDDLEKQVLTLPESDRGTLIEKRQNLMNTIYTSLKPETVLCDRPSDDHFIQVLAVRKGRKLVARVLPLLDRKEAQCVIQAILRNLSFLLKKESQEMQRELKDLQKGNVQETLPKLIIPVWRCIQSTSLSELTCIVKQLTAGASGVSPPRQYSSVMSLQLQSKFGVSIVLCLLSQGERIYTTTSMVDLEEDTQNDWVDCVNQIAKDICVVDSDSIPQPLLMFNNILPHFARFVSKQTFNALETRLGSITEDKIGK